MNSSPRSVLVTGCSTGIGRATALLLSERGYRVFAGVRSPEQMAELSAIGSPLLTPLTLKVTSESDIASAQQLIQESCPEGLYGLVNNAGVGLPSAVELSSANDLRELLEINTIAPLRLIQTFLPMLRMTKGRVVNMSSMNGYVSIPSVGAYSASKFALEALSDALRVELRPWQISVSIIRPGQVRTPIFAKAGAEIVVRKEDIPHELRNGYEEFYDRAAKYSERGVDAPTRPENVARVVLKALEARWPRPYYQVGLDAHRMNVLKRVVPTRVLDRLLARAMGLMERVD